MGPNDKALFMDSSQYKYYWQKCYAFAKSYTYDTAQAECLASEAMIVLWKKQQGGGEIEHLLSFLYSTIRNLSLNYLKHKQSELKLKDGVQSEMHRELQLRIDALVECDPSLLYSVDISGIVDKVLSSLPSKTETVFRLSRFNGMSNKEIAAVLGLSEKAVEYHMTRSLKVLREELQDYLPLLLFFSFWGFIS